MGLSSDHIPFTRSLSERVFECFEPFDLEPEQTLPREDVIAYLAKSKDGDASPLATIERRASKQDRAPNLSHSDSARIAWVSKAFEEWEERFPLESRIRDELHRLLPLAAAMALKDESFLTPGAHPLHQLLDALQNGAVGWQVRLDRAGQMLEQRVQRSVEKAIEWFNDETLDLSLITRELVAANERDAARAQRMVQRLAETEEARLRTLSAKHDAALFINGALQEYELPAAIGEFLKGPWFDSAQLVLVKHGPDSDQWAQMQRATWHLAQSVQDPGSGDDSLRDRREQMLRHLPGELRRWLLSLEHDSDATDSAIGLVEYAHLRLQHGQQVQRDRIDPLPVEEALNAEVSEARDESRTGDWYTFEDENGGLRAQLTLQLDGGEHLIFTNFVGLKAIDLPRKIFLQRREDGFARHLPNIGSFSLSLARSAGIKNDRDYQLFLDPNAEIPEEIPEELPEERPEEVSEETLVPGIEEHTSAESDPSTPETRGRENPAGGVSGPDDSENGRALQTDTAPYADAHSEAGGPDAPPESGAVEAREPRDLVPADTGAAGSNEVSSEGGLGYEPILAAPEGAETDLELELEPIAPATAPATTAQVPQSYAPPENPPEGKRPSGQITPGYSPPGYPQPAYSQPDRPPPVGNPPVGAPPTDASAPGSAPNPARPPVPRVPPGYEQFNPDFPPMPTLREVDVPMGAWLGFHDGETPIMAKLAVYDPRRDNYIFVNRKGIALRELNRAQLLELMDKGQVDILETRSYFREEVERAREEKP